jgi:hypothetical protein
VSRALLPYQIAVPLLRSVIASDYLSTARLD